MVLVCIGLGRAHVNGEPHEMDTERTEDFDLRQRCLLGIAALSTGASQPWRPPKVHPRQIGNVRGLMQYPTNMSWNTKSSVRLVSAM